MEPEDKIEVVNAPQEIWLNFGDLSDVVTGTVEYSELYASGEISWCYHEVDATDVRYVRADCYETRVKDLQTTLKLLTQDRAEIGNAREALAAYGVGEGSLHQGIVRLALKQNQEIERLRSDRDLEKQMRKDAEDRQTELEEGIERLKGLLREAAEDLDSCGKYSKAIAYNREAGGVTK